MHKPLLSVIVPVYKSERFINECIESVLSQTFSDWELVLIDDGSPDNSGAICDEYAMKDNRIKVFHQKNGGVCAARNKGLDNATGEYILFLDSDDYMPKDAVETLYNDAIMNNADIAIGRMLYDTEQSRTDNSLEIWSGKEALIKEMEDHPALYGCCTKLFKREIIKDVRFIEGRRVHEDSFFLFLAMIKLPIITVRNKCTYIYRNNPDSASQEAFSDKYFDVLYFFNEKKRIIDERFPELSEKFMNKLVKAHMTMLQLFCRTKDKRYNKDVKHSIKMVRKYSKYFVPAVTGEKKFFLIVKYGGYPFFRRLYWIKYRKVM